MTQNVFPVWGDVNKTAIGSQGVNDVVGVLHQVSKSLLTFHECFFGLPVFDVAADEFGSRLQQPNVLLTPLALLIHIIEADDAVPFGTDVDRQDQNRLDVLGFQHLAFPLGKLVNDAMQRPAAGENFLPAPETLSIGHMLKQWIIHFRRHARRTDLVSLPQAQAVFVVFKVFEYVHSADIRRHKQMQQRVVQGLVIVSSLQQGSGAGSQSFLISQTRGDFFFRLFALRNVSCKTNSIGGLTMIIVDGECRKLNMHFATGFWMADDFTTKAAGFG